MNHGWTMKNIIPVLQGEQIEIILSIIVNRLARSCAAIEHNEKTIWHFFPFSVGCLYAWSEDPLQ